MSVLSNFSSFRAVKASHILLHSDGTVSLTGLRYSYQLPLNKHQAHNFPDHGLHMLAWIAPEILQQVRSFCNAYA